MVGVLFLLFIINIQMVQSLPATVREVGPIEPTNQNEYFPPKVFYDFVEKDYLDQSQIDAIKLPLCPDVISPLKVIYRTGARTKFDTEVTIIPSNFVKRVGWISGKISNCNPWKDQESCKFCIKLNKAIKVLFNLWKENYYHKDQKSIIASSYCLIFLKEDCGVTVCKNGQYSSEYMALDSENFATSHARCIPCKPGTWLTCLEDASCSYTIPQQNEKFDNSVYFSPSSEIPVGNCFSCPSASGNKAHYAKTPRYKITGYFQQGSDKPLPWYCPGGDSPPLNCTAPFVGANSNYTGCICAQGWFKVGDNDCQICQPGYMCPNGESIECPDNYYQDKEGATSCTLCHQDGFASGCGPGTSLRKCVGRFKKEPPTCINCNICRRSYLTNPAGRVECYDQ